MNSFLNAYYHFYAGKPGAPSVPSYVSPQPTYVSPQPTYQKPSAGYPGSPGTYHIYIFSTTRIVFKFFLMLFSLYILCGKIMIILLYLS